MGHWKELVPSDWIRAVDIHGDWTVQIERITFESVASLDTKEDGKKKRKGAIWFAGVDKGWLINTTNAQLIAAMFGDDPEGWIGHALTIYAARVRGADGQPTLGIRVKGSPELRAEVKATVVLPRRKPGQVKLVPTTAGQASEPGAEG